MYGTSAASGLSLDLAGDGGGAAGASPGGDGSGTTCDVRTAALSATFMKRNSWDAHRARRSSGDAPHRVRFMRRMTSRRAIMARADNARSPCRWQPRPRLVSGIALRYRAATLQQSTSAAEPAEPRGIEAPSHEA